MTRTYLIGGPSPFPIITSFLEYAITRQSPPANTKEQKHVRSR